MEHNKRIIYQQHDFNSEGTYFFALPLNVVIINK
jgi:hypothetical protein